MRVIAILVMLLIGMLIVSSLPIISPGMKTLVNVILFAVAMWRITIHIYLLMEKYPTLPVESAED